MVSFEDLKVMLSTYIVRNRKVSYQDLLKWSSSNRVGNTLLYLIIKELIREKRFKASGEYVIGTIRVGDNDIKLSIPMYIEVTGTTAKSVGVTKRQVKQRPAKSASILETIGREEQESPGGVKSEERTKEKATLEKTEKPASTSEPSNTEERHNEGINETENKIEEKTTEGKVEVITEPESTLGLADYSSISTDNFMTLLRNAVSEEVPQNREEAFKIAVAMLAYLSKYWSVGELRLKLDVARQFGGVNENTLRIEDGVLRALRKMGLVEVVEPGVVNRVKELPKDFIKVRLDSLFT
ncbi:MAG: hypothetical protein ACP5GY_02895 [Vulcanisaeta sp.]